jgi:hypothetical protein
VGLAKTNHELWIRLCLDALLVEYNGVGGWGCFAFCA